MSINPALNKVIGTVLPLFSIRSQNDDPDSCCGTVTSAFALLEWFAKTGQGAWQILPLSQTHLEPGSDSVHVSSPYKGYGVGLDPRYLSDEWATASPQADELADYVKQESAWLKEYAVFCAIRDHFGTDDWSVWPEIGLRSHQPETLRAWANAHQDAVQRVYLEQWRLYRAFTALRKRAQELKIEIIGDLPFYIPRQSPLVWANQDCFDLEPDGTAKRVSGIPDGPASHFGRQIWGHPLYKWGNHRINRRIADLWRLRLQSSKKLYDTLRLDHAKGLFNFGVIDLDDPSADDYRIGPGLPMLEEIISQAKDNDIRLMAEDSGDRINELQKALHEKGIPGIRILRFAWNEKKQKLETNFADVDNYPPNAYAYTSTTDTITLYSYVLILTEAEKRHLCLHVGVTYTDDNELLANRLRQRLIDSPAGHAMIPLADWFLWTERINVPGTETLTDDPNWRWRMPVDVESLPEKILSHPIADS